MSKYPPFSKSPITEALLDIRVELPSSFDVSQFDSFYDKVKNRFPQKQKKMGIATHFRISETGMETDPSPSVPMGFLYRSSTDGKIVQARRDGFTFNKLKPYEKWEVFKQEAHELWNTYISECRPSRITRIALRYINKIEIPMPFDFNDYILTIPKIPEKLPQDLSSFFMRFSIANPHMENTLANITQTFQAPSEGRLPFIFDIDVFQIKEYGDSNEMWEAFESLRAFKNDVFLESLTTRAKD